MYAPRKPLGTSKAESDGERFFFLHTGALSDKIQYLISFMLVNPETTTRRKRRRKQKPLQIIFPKPVRKLRANPEYVDRARTRSKALVGNLTGKHVAGSLGGAAATIAVPNAIRLRGWSDVMASGAVSIGGGIAVKQMDEGAGDALMLLQDLK
jgi:hypothetical protein